MGMMKWTEERLAEEASKFETRGEFKKGSPRAYDCARKRKLLDTVCSHMSPVYQSWSHDTVHKEALKYTSPQDFKSGSIQAYQSMCHNGWHNVMNHMERQLTVWTDELLHEVASRYNNRTEFSKHDPAAYKMIQKTGRIEEFCQHMPLKSTVSRNNVIYIWEATEWSTDDLIMCKIGSTSDETTQDRVQRISSAMGVTPNLISRKQLPVSVKATDLEKELLSYGSHTDVTDAEGYTELRRLKPIELALITKRIDEVAI